MGTWPASVIRCPTATKVATSHAGCDIIAHSHERRAAVITAAAGRMTTFVTSIIRGTSTDAAAHCIGRRFASWLM